MAAAWVKKYIVRLNPEERDQLETILGKGKHSARQPLKARILLKADVSEGDEGWIVEALDTAKLFMLFAPLEGWRPVDRHTAIDYVCLVKELSDTWFPDAARIVPTQGNLNARKPAAWEINRNKHHAKAHWQFTTADARASSIGCRNVDTFRTRRMRAMSEFLT